MVIVMLENFIAALFWSGSNQIMIACEFASIRNCDKNKLPEKVIVVHQFLDFKSAVIPGPRAE